MGQDYKYIFGAMTSLMAGQIRSHSRENRATDKFSKDMEDYANAKEQPGLFTFPRTELSQVSVITLGFGHIEE